MISARMRAGATWSDACILDLSTRGMLVRSATMPQRGAYVEVRRGVHVIVARVVWSSPDRFGVQTQDPVPADRLILDPEGISAPPASSASGFLERRAATRPPRDRHDRSRRTARAMEFGTLLLLGAVATAIVGDAVAHTFGKPMTALNVALGGD